MKKSSSIQARKKHDWITYGLFVFPAVFFFALVVLVPFIQGIYFSFTNWNGLMTGSQTFVGLKNYIDAFADEKFRYSAMKTLGYGVCNFLVINLVSFCLALIVSSKLKGKHIYRTAFFLPNLIGGLVLGYVWKFIYNYTIPTIFNGLLMLTSPKDAFIALIVTSTWQSAGYYMMIYYTALQNVPNDLLESAELDGAKWFNKLIHITIPMIMPTITIVFFLTLSSSLSTYDVIVSLTNGGPSTMFAGKAVNSTELIAVNIFNTGSVNNNMALAQAKAVIFFIALCIISFIQTYLNKKKEMEL